MTTPRCELCRFWDGPPKPSESQVAEMHEILSRPVTELTYQICQDAVDMGAPTKGTCRRMPSHDIRHKDDWCGEFVDAGVDSSPELLEDLKRIIRES